MVKAQVSVFIIIASIIAILLTGTYVLTSNINWFQDETPSYRVAEFVEACILEQTREGVNKLGRQGGWIYPPEGLYAGRGDDLIVSRAIGFEDIGNTKLPYWYYYDESDDEFRVDTYIPDYDSSHPNSMKNQLKQYLDETVETRCIQGFSVFDDAYDVTPLVEELNHSVEFREDDIAVSLYYPVEIQELNSDATESISNYLSVTENKLRVPYHLARDMAYAMDGSSFLEYRLMQMLHPYMSKDTRDLLPPRYDLGISFDMQPWIVPEVKEVVQQIFATNIHAIQLREGYERDYPSFASNNPDSAFAQGVNDMYRKYYLGNPNAEDYSVIREDNPRLFSEYQYVDVRGHYDLYYPFEFSITPSTGGVIVLPQAEMFVDFIPMGITSYQSAYEFTGPTVFSFRDQRLSDNDNFEFRVAYEVNVANNKPLRERFTGLDDFDPSDAMSSSEQSLVCDPPQRVSAPVRVNITDSIGDRQSLNDPIRGVDGAMIEFHCRGEMATCFVGQTSTDDIGRSDVEFNLPVNCDPGSLSISKFGHKSVKLLNVNPSIDEEIEIGEIDLPSTRELELEVLLREDGEQAMSQRRSLTSIEEGFIMFEHKDDDYVEFVNLDSDSFYDLTVNLMPGEYLVNAFVIAEREGNVIREEEICFSSGMLGIGSDCETLPEIDLETWITGIYEQESFTVTQEDLLTSSKLEFPIVRMGMPTTYDGLDSMSALLDDPQALSEQFSISFE